MCESLIVGFVISLVVARWLLPISKTMSSEAVYSQTLGFTSAAADVIDIADYMQDSEISEVYFLLKAVQVVFGFSLIQFSFSIAATKKRNSELNGIRKILDLFFSTEAWSLVLLIFTQELPCLILRIIIYSSINTNRTGYAVYFFTVKNGLMIILLIYRIAFIIYKQLKKEKQLHPQCVCFERY